MNENLDERMTLDDIISDLWDINEDLIDSIDWINAQYGEEALTTGNLRTAKQLVIECVIALRKLK